MVKFSANFLIEDDLPALLLISKRDFRPFSLLQFNKSLSKDSFSS